jgi:hypothetical protein
VAKICGGLDPLVDLFATYHTWLQFQFLLLLPHTTVHNSLGHFLGCFSNSWNWHQELSCTLQLSRTRTGSPVFNLSYLVIYGCAVKGIPASRFPVSVPCALPRICASTSRLPTKFHVRCSANATAGTCLSKHVKHLYISLSCISVQLFAKQCFAFC